MRDFERPGKSTAHALNGMVATSHPSATQAALSVLQAGGNAMDAALTACAVQAVVEPQSTGIGGDCFCLYKPVDGSLVAFNGSGGAPSGADAQLYAEKGISTFAPYSPHAVTIPGALDAWDQLLRDHGTMGLADILAPAEAFARDGYVVHERVHYDWSCFVDLMQRDPTAARIFLPHGKPPPVGSIHRQPELADTLAYVAKSGRDGFYKGRVAEALVAYLQGLGGLQTSDDFAAHAGEYVTPIKTAYRGYDVYECPPNGQGIVALAILNLFSGLGLDALDPVSADRFHLEIEAARLAYRDRDLMLADPAFADLPVEHWLSEGHAATLRAHIDPHKAMAPLPPSDFPNHKDTVTISVVDKDRNAVSLINSVFSPFGSGLVCPQTGVLLHNRGGSFSLVPGHPNAIAPGKRPLHTIIPGMVMRQGRAVMPFGVMGGHYQACGHAHFLANILDYGMSLQEAMDAPRVFPVAAGTVDVEGTVPISVQAELTARGHVLSSPPRPIGGAQAVWIDWDQGTLRGGSDSRKDGMALGY